MLYYNCVFILISMKNNVHSPVVGFQYYLKRKLFTFYNRSLILNFVKSTYNFEFTDNTTFGVKNYLISSLIPFTYWHNLKYTCFTHTIYILTQLKVYVLHVMFQFEYKKHSWRFHVLYVQTCTKLWQFCIICNAYCNKF